MVGAISGVHDGSDDVLVRSISAPKKVIHEYRLGTSSCVKILFVGDSLPSHVKAGLVRFPVQSFVPRAIQSKEILNRWSHAWSL